VKINFDNIGFNFGEYFRELNEYFASMNRDLREAFKRFQSALEKAEDLGKIGWTLPVDATPGEVTGLMESISDIESADKVFIDFYAEDGAIRLEWLKKRLRSSPDLQQWKAVLEEAITNYSEGRHRSCVALLLPLIEGVTAKKFKEPQFHKEKSRKKFFSDKLKDENENTSLISSYMWRSYRGFAETLFKAVNFSAPFDCQQSLNRHWLLHGRGILESNPSDSLRLLQALGTIVELRRISKDN